MYVQKSHDILCWPIKLDTFEAICNLEAPEKGTQESYLEEKGYFRYGYGSSKANSDEYELYFMSFQIEYTSCYEISPASCIIFFFQLCALTSKEDCKFLA